MALIPRRNHGVYYHTAANLDALDGITHGFSTRIGGVSTGVLSSLNLRGAEVSGDQPENVLENYRRFCAAIGADERRVVLSKQVHGDMVRLVTAADAGKGLYCPRDYEADGLITNQPGLPLFVFSADCMVLLLCDPEAGCIGAVHAGWRGTALNIAARAVEQMAARLGAVPGRIQAAIGPGIGPCCFETDEDVPAAMRSAMGREAEPFLHPQGGKWMVDLPELNRRQLILAGVPAEQITVAGLCTACHPEQFWSHRRMGNARGVQAAAIMLKEPTVL